MLDRVTVDDKNSWLYPLKEKIEWGGDSALSIKVANLFGGRRVDICFETPDGAKGRNHPFDDSSRVADNVPAGFSWFQWARRSLCNVYVEPSFLVEPCR
ncbi:hypothetical protein [Cupriavidus alkaliphilus]|uniref:hypothetical protein n=1 Tax=Cupriavidus alkaliphilus TaxID=942866 RepID=UPI00339D5332